MKPRMSIPVAFLLAALPAMALAQEKPEVFLKKTIQDNLTEIDAGKLAQKQASSAAVKTFGEQLVTDHTAANEDAKTLAKSLGVAAPAKPGSGEQAALGKLEKLKGAEFDKAFAAQMVKDHEKTIREFEKEASGTGPAADFAKKHLPILKSHLDAAKKLESGA